MDINIETIVTILAVCYGVVSGVCAFIEGKRKAKTTKALSKVEQQNDLREYMIGEIESAESTGKLFAKSNNISEWKKDTVLKNVTLYAKGQGYTWYDKDEWSQKIDDYIKGTKKVNFTVSSVN